MFARNDFYFRLQLLLIIIHITYISLSLRRTSAPIHLTSVLGVLGTQETSCILIAGLLERDIFDLFLPEFDKPWVIHLRETCCCSTNLCTWRPNTIYKNRSVRRHQWPRHQYILVCFVLFGSQGSWRGVNSTNVLDEGLRIGEIGRRMNSKVNSVKQGGYESKRGYKTWLAFNLAYIVPS
jgi:hypothetical protein